MNWKTQAALATVLGILGLIVMFNPVSVITAAGSIIPWLLLLGAAIQIVSILFRSRRRFRVVIGPALLAALLAYAGLSMKFGDAGSIGPVSLAFVLSLLLIGSSVAKAFLAVSVKRSKYFLMIMASAVLSALLGLIVFFNWSVVSAGLIGVFIGLELIADAVAMAAMALRDRDGEESMEARGLDPAEEAAKAAAAAAALSAAAAAIPTPAPAPAPAPAPLPTAYPPAPADSPALQVMQQAQLPDPPAPPPSATPDDPFDPKP